MYIEGKLMAEGHSLSEEEVGRACLRRAGMVTSHEVDANNYDRVCAEYERYYKAAP
jgi:hypothetical protein